MPSASEIATEIIRRLRRDGVSVDDPETLRSDLEDTIDPDRPVDVIYHDLLEKYRDDDTITL